MVAVGLKKLMRGGIDAEEIGGGVLDEGLGVDGAGEMHVEVGALGHAGEEGVEFERALLCGVEGADGALLARGCGWESRSCREARVVAASCANERCGEARQKQKQRGECGVRMRRSMGVLASVRR